MVFQESISADPAGITAAGPWQPQWAVASGRCRI